MILRIILFALVAYILYKLVFELIIPIARATQKIRRQFGAMQDQVNTTQNGYSSQNQPSPEQNKPRQSAKAGDYIDFEEVK